MLTKVVKFIRAHQDEIKHDAALFAGAFAATGVLDNGSIDANLLVAASITAGRRVIVAAAPRLATWALSKLHKA